MTVVTTLKKFTTQRLKMIHYVFIVVVQSILPFQVTQTVFILFVVTVLQKRECIKEYLVKSDALLVCTFTILSIYVIHVKSFNIVMKCLTSLWNVKNDLPPACDFHVSESTWPSGVPQGSVLWVYLPYTASWQFTWSSWELIFSLLITCDLKYLILSTFWMAKQLDIDTVSRHTGLNIR